MNVATNQDLYKRWLDECVERVDELSSAWEIDFVESLEEQRLRNSKFELSIKQGETLERIFEKLIA